MRGPSLDLKAHITDRIASQSTSHVWSPVDFLDLASRDAVDKALQRLAHDQDLRRIDRGLYDQLRTSRLTGKPAPPDYRAVIAAIARRDQTPMLVDGMTAANDLGLSEAVPGRVVVHTAARLRPVRIGNLTLTFRPTAPSKLFWAGRPAMRVVQALHWLRCALSDPTEYDRILARLKVILSDTAHGCAIREDLAAGLPTLPAWMQAIVRRLLHATEATQQGDGSEDKNK